MKTHKKRLLLPMLTALLLILPQNLNPLNANNMDEYYCEYCGHKFPNVRLLVTASCSRHPAGPNKGNHKLYEGAPKSQYTCKYCGKTFPSIMVMTGGTCTYHPNGSNKGPHAPAL
ncbi:MAG: hypothetical protein MR215_01290 [Bacteroidales bacterium]|nr:hypothetical protein [Bacteroidales bacterium]